MEIVILAGGKGTRMGEQTEKVPKPMICVGGRPVLIHLLDYYLQWGATRFVVCCGYKSDYIVQYFTKRYGNTRCIDNNAVSIDYKNSEVILVNTGENTGTAGRIAKIQSYLDEKVFHLTYGDGLSNINIDNLLEQHIKSQRRITISAVHPRERFGLILFDEDNKVLQFQEKIKRSDSWINGGFMVLDTTVFEFINDSDISLEYDILPRLVAKEMVGVYKHTGFWQCMDTEDEKKELDRVWALEEAPWVFAKK